MSTSRMLAAIVFVAFALPATAHADRAPTRAEHAAVSKAVGVPKRCVRVRVSTVNRRWARANIRLRKASCRR